MTTAALAVKGRSLSDAKDFLSMSSHDAESRMSTQDRLSALEGGASVRGASLSALDVKSDTALKKEALKAASANAMASCLMYVASSTLMVLVNKWLASSLDVQAHVRCLFETSSDPARRSRCC